MPVAEAAHMGRPRSKHEYEAVKLRKEVLRRARVVAASRNIPLSEYISERLLPLVQADEEEYARNLLDAAEEGEPKPRRRKPD